MTAQEPAVGTNTPSAVSVPPGDGTKALSPFERVALPWALAAVEYSGSAWTAMFLGGDWAEAEAAYDRMVAAQVACMSGLLAGRSGAATELDYYESARAPFCKFCSACHPAYPCDPDCHICWPLGVVSPSGTEEPT